MKSRADHLMRNQRVRVELLEASPKSWKVEVKYPMRTQSCMTGQTMQTNPLKMSCVVREMTNHCGEEEWR